MSQYLKSILDDQATSVAFKPPNVETITRVGHRRILRRRAVVLAGVAVVALLAGVAVALGGPGGETSNVPSGPWPAGTVSWAVGSTIHAGSDAIDVGRPVRAYVRTALGFAFVDDADDVYSVTEAGVSRIGHLTATLPNNADQQRVVSNARGTLVGWVGEEPSGSLTLVAYDQATGRSRAYPGPGAGSLEGVLFFAIDGRTAYWKTPTGVYAVNLDTGRERLITAGPAYDFEVYSAENGMFAFSPNADRTFYAGLSVDAARKLRDLTGLKSTGHADPVRLSPAATWLSLGVVEIAGGPSEDSFRVASVTPEVYDTATGQRLNLRIPGDPAVAIPNVWIDDTTLQVVANGHPSDPASEVLNLYTCTLPDGSCSLAAVIPVQATETGALPDGRWYGQGP
jgi:hypothetical protein